MGGGHGGSTTYKGVTLHHPKRWHVVTGKGLCAVMCSGYYTGLSKMVLWFWAGGILGRDMMTMFMGVNIRHPFKWLAEKA